MDSDQGSQYCSAVYQKLLCKHQLICNLSKKGDCYDKAAMESWNTSYRLKRLMKQQVFEYIEVYYNRKQLHSNLGYRSPEAYELNFVA